MAAGAIAVIFINDDGDMVAPRLEPERDPEMHAWLAEIPTICLTKPDGDRLRCENTFSDVKIAPFFLLKATTCQDRLARDKPRKIDVKSRPLSTMYRT